MSKAISQDIVRQMLTFASAIGKDYGFATDNSDQSIQNVSDYLNDLKHQILQNPEFDNEAISGIATSLGMYIGEVLRERFSALESQWLYGVPATGGGETAYVAFGENELYPIDWVMKQIDGDGASVFDKFKMFEQRLNTLL